jgi:transposase-like protein
MDCPECITKEKLVEYPGYENGKRVVKYECPVCGYTVKEEEK